MRSTRVADENQLEWHKARKLPANKSLREEVNSSEEASIAKIKVQWTGGKPQRRPEVSDTLLYMEDWTQLIMYHVPDLAKLLERMALNAKVASFLGSILASSDTEYNLRGGR
jgi:hypothetical protein